MTTKHLSDLNEPLLETNAVRAWYREPYVWLVITFPATAVVAGVITLWIAIVSYDGLVRRDYYKHGLEINRVLKRVEMAKTLGLEMTVAHIANADSDRLEVAVSANDSFEFPELITAYVTHLTRQSGDRIVALSRVGEAGHYQIETSKLPAGPWQLQIETDEWKLDRRFIVH